MPQVFPAGPVADDDEILHWNSSRLSAVSRQPSAFSLQLSAFSFQTNQHRCHPEWPSGREGPVHFLAKAESSAQVLRCAQDDIPSYGSSKSRAYTSWLPTSCKRSGEPSGVRPIQETQGSTTRRKFCRSATRSSLWSAIRTR